MIWEKAPDANIILKKIIKTKLFPHVKISSIHAFRGFGSTSRAIARIWSLPKVWQQALEIQPQYVVEVIKERFDKLSPEDKTKVLIHELMHIPKTFSGALLSHRNRGRHVNHHNVEVLYKQYVDYYSR